MKIKRKVEMTHEEYAKYMIDKFGIASYERELIDNNIFDAPMEFEQTFTLNPMRKDDDLVIERSFKGVVIEVEEEITEETEFRELVGLRADDSYWKYDNTCVYDFNLEIIKAIYIPNNDLTMTLIWRDGKMVE